MMAASGYIANEVQTSATISTIMFNCFLLPAILAVCQSVCFLFVKYNDKAHEEVLEQMKAAGLNAD